MVGFHECRADSIAPNAPVAVFHRNRPRQLQHRPLGHAIHAFQPKAFFAANRRRDHNRPTAIVQHMRHHFAAHHKGGFSIDPHKAVVFLISGQVHRFYDNRARMVEQRVYTAKTGHSLRNGSLHGGGIRHIGFNENRPSSGAAYFCRRIAARVFCNIQNGHICPRLGKNNRSGPPHTTRAAGDNSSPPGKTAFDVFSGPGLVELVHSSLRMLKVCFLYLSSAPTICQ